MRARSGLQTLLVAVAAIASAPGSAVGAVHAHAPGTTLRWLEQDGQARTATLR